MNKDLANILSIAFANSIAISLLDLKNLNTIPENFRKFYQKKINPNIIQDKELIKQEELYDYINWEILDRNKAIRILSRDINLLERIKIERYEFKISELYPIFLLYPELIEQMVVDFTKITPIEAIKLLECNIDLIEIIDITKFNFNKKDMSEIIKKFRTYPKIMERLDLSNLDHFTTRKLICKTGFDYIDKLNIKQLKATDWIEILEEQPDLIEFCDITIFETGDCYFLTKLVLSYPEKYYLIEKNCEKISALGWENLIKEDLEKYEDICKWEKFTETNWNNIIIKHPKLSIKKQNYFIF